MRIGQEGDKLERIDANTARRTNLGESLGPVVHGRFGAAVKEKRGKWANAGHGADVQNDTPSLLQMGQSEQTKMDGAKHKCYVWVNCF